MLHDFDESAELKKQFAEVGAGVMMGGRIGETIEFYYLDTEPSLKIILESGSGHAIELRAGLRLPVKQMRAALR